MPSPCDNIFLRKNKLSSISHRYRRNNIQLPSKPHLIFYYGFVLMHWLHPVIAWRQLSDSYSRVKEYSIRAIVSITQLLVKIFRDTVNIFLNDLMSICHFHPYLTDPCVIMSCLSYYLKRITRKTRWIRETRWRIKLECSSCNCTIILNNWSTCIWLNDCKHFGVDSNKHPQWPLITKAAADDLRGAGQNEPYGHDTHL